MTGLPNLGTLRPAFGECPVCERLLPRADLPEHAAGCQVKDLLTEHAAGCQVKDLLAGHAAGCLLKDSLAGHAAGFR